MTVKFGDWAPLEPSDFAEFGRGCEVVHIAARPMLRDGESLGTQVRIGTALPEDVSERRGKNGEPVVDFETDYTVLHGSHVLPGPLRQAGHPLSPQLPLSLGQARKILHAAHPPQVQAVQASTAQESQPILPAAYDRVAPSTSIRR